MKNSSVRIALACTMSWALVGCVATTSEPMVPRAHVGVAAELSQGTVITSVPVTIEGDNSGIGTMGGAGVGGASGVAAAGGGGAEAIVASAVGAVAGSIVGFLIDGKKIKCSGKGNGPVNALDNAIRENFSKVEKYYDFFSDLKLLDYKVRILNTGTEATTRVLIESTDKTGVSWFTIGVSPNIIEASFRALIDSLDYKLFKEKAPANIKLNAK